MNKFLISAYYRFPLLRKIKSILRISTPKVTENLNWHPEHQIKFTFTAPLKVVQQAKEKGIEGTILRTSLKLLQYDRNHENNKVVIDVGASWGFLSLVYARSVCHPNGKVISFEPHPDIHQTFSHTIKKNHLDKRIYLYQSAVGDVNIDKTPISIINGSTNMTVSSEETISVKQVKLDNLVNKLERVDLVKVDVDGYEFNVMMGALDLIDKFDPIWIVEINDDHRVIPFFKERGYHIYDEHMRELGLKKPYNIVCIPESLSDLRPNT